MDGNGKKVINVEREENNNKHKHKQTHKSRILCI